MYNIGIHVGQDLTYLTPGAQIGEWIPEPIEVEAYVPDAGLFKWHGVGAGGGRDVVTARREGRQKRNPQVVIFAPDKEQVSSH